MWRASRNVFANRSTPIRLWPLQAADKNDGGTNEVEERQRKGSENRRKDRVAFFISVLSSQNGPSSSESVDNGFRLAHNIVHRIQVDGQKKLIDLGRSIGNDDSENENSKRIFGNLKSWWHGVLALSGVLGVQHFAVGDRPVPWRIDPKHLPQVLMRLKRPTPEASLAVLPVMDCTQAKKEMTKDEPDKSDDLVEAIETFQSTFSECSAAMQNTLGKKFAALNQRVKAFLLFSMASKKGHPSAQFNLGLCYEHGRGTDRDVFKAAKCYQAASAQGHGGALYNLATFYQEGIAGLPVDQHKSVELLEAAAQSGLTKAKTYLGLHYAKPSEHQDVETAFSYFHMAAAEKDPVAEYYTGVCYERGLGVEKDLQKAAYWYRIAAQHGHSTAQHNLGVFYEHGLGDLPVDKREALRFYRMAAEAGDEDALHNLKLLKEELKEGGPQIHSSQSTLLFDLIHGVTSHKGGRSPRVPDVNGIPRCSSSPLFSGTLHQDVETSQPGKQSTAFTGQLLAF